MNWKYYRTRGTTGNSGAVIRVQGPQLDWYNFVGCEWVNMFGIDKHTDISEFLLMHRMTEISKADVMLVLL